MPSSTTVTPESVDANREKAKGERIQENKPKALVKEKLQLQRGVNFINFGRPWLATNWGD